jgi:hypothetical protein
MEGRDTVGRPCRHDNKQSRPRFPSGSRVDVCSGNNQGALLVEMAIEDSTHTLVDRGLREVNIELLQVGDSNIVFFELSA